MHRSRARPPLGGSGCGLPGVPLSLLRIRRLNVLLVLIASFAARGQRVFAPRWRIWRRHLARGEVRTYPGRWIGYLLPDRVAVDRTGRAQSG